MASVRERPLKGGGSTWQVLYRHGGKQTSKAMESEEAAEDLKTLIDRFGPDKALRMLAEDQGEDGITVDELFERWIEWKAGTEVTDRTIRDYRRDYNNWIMPAFGHRRADYVDELDVQQWVDRMKARLDPKSVGDRHMILGSMYRFGVARSRRLVAHNPCGETQLPSKKKKAPKGFTLAQWDAMYAWASEHEPDAADLLLFIASTGWRFSECTALTAAAVDDYGNAVAELDGERIEVPNVFVSVLGVHREDEHYRRVYVEGVAKSEAGVRRINLLPDAALMLRRRLVGKGPGDLIFTSPRGHMWRSSNFLERPFARILAGAGIEKVRGMGPHYLRHTHVGILDRAGVSIAKMQRRIGHEDIRTTLNVYGGMIDNALSPEELVRAHRQLQRPAIGGPVVRGEVVSEAAQVLMGELEV